MRLLIIGAMDGQIGAAARIARGRGARVTHCVEAESALENLRSGKGADLIMMDVRQDIKRMVEQLREEHIVVPLIACGANTSKEEAVAAINAGAKEYVPLPPDETLIAAVLEAVTEEHHALLFRSATMTKAAKMAEQVAPSDAHVLIGGESGTGKEAVARLIHRKSKRSGQPFISVNCAAIPETLLESELFGHEKGAFTGAVARRLGKFEEASGGTLLLDEVSEMDIRLQAKLLRAIQEKEIDRLGGNKPVKVDLRIVATSNRNLRDEVKAGKFREDLFFRLNVITIPLPPLRERKEDIPLLAVHFGEKYAKANGVKAKSIDDSALKRLEAHNWPGNVRELENIMHRAVLMAESDTITAEAILIEEIASQNAVAGGTAGGFVGRTVASMEQDLIIQTLLHCLGNRTQAANILGISLRTLRNKLKQYSEEGVTLPSVREGERG